MSRSPSLFKRVLSAAGRRIASDPRVPAENRAALAAHVEHVLWEECREVFGGDRFKVMGSRVRAPDMEPRERQARGERITQALAAGESGAAIARREGVHHANVYRRRPRTAE